MGAVGAVAVWNRDAAGWNAAVARILRVSNTAMARIRGISSTAVASLVRDMRKW